MSRTRVALLVSNKLRDLAGLTYFKVLLETQLGLDVQLVNMANWRYLLAHRPHVVMIPSIVNPAVSGEFVRFLKGRGMLVVALPTEGVLRCEEEVSLIYGSDLTSIREIDLALLWGRGMVDLLSRFYGLSTDKLEVVGPLRFDFYRTPLSDLYFTNRGAFCAALGLNPEWPIVVWATGYPGAERFRERAHQDQDEATYKGLAVPGFTGLEFVRMQIAAQDAAFAGVESLIRSLSNVNFVIKVRPDETTVLYDAMRARSKTDARLAIVKSEPVFSLVQAADVWLHWNSTTSTEAWFFDRPSINLLLGTAREYVIEDMAKGSLSAYTENDLYDAVSRVLKDPSIPAPLAAAREAFITRWFHRIDGQAGSRHVAAVQRLLGVDRVPADAALDWGIVRVKMLSELKRRIGRESYESVFPWKRPAWDMSGLASRNDIREQERLIGGVLGLSQGDGYVHS
jgi:surface carbohydrate biosynthesis protein